MAGAVPYTLILGNVLGFGYYLPTVGLAISAFSGVVLWTWYLLVAWRFFQVGHNPAPSTRWRLPPRRRRGDDVIRIEGEIVIARPVEEVFDLVADAQ